MFGVSNIMKYHYNLKQLFSILIYFKAIYDCDGKGEFSAVITPVFSVTWSFRNHSNMLIWLLSMLKTVELLNFL